MGKHTNVGSLPPNHKRFSTGTQVFTYKRPEVLDEPTEESLAEEQKQNSTEKGQQATISPKPFSLFWLPAGQDNQHYLIPRDFKGQVPWFIWGENLESFKANGTFTLSEECLLKGILYGLSPSTNKLGATYREEDLLAILDKIWQGNFYENREGLILDAAYNTKGENGVLASLSILRAGIYLLPKSSTIKSDYIMNLWEKACEDKDDTGIYKEILELIPKIDLTSIYSSAKECICYYGLCSLFLLKKDVNKYIEQYIHGVKISDEIQLKINDLLDNQDKAFTPKELRVHDD
jgi:hypothetical protein